MKIHLLEKVIAKCDFCKTEGEFHLLPSQSYYQHGGHSYLYFCMSCGETYPLYRLINNQDGENKPLEGLK